MNLRHLELSFRRKHLSTSYSPAYKRRICPRSHHAQNWWGGTTVWDINRSFNQLRLLAALGILPRNLLKVKPPKCAVCLYGAMKNPPWCTKYADNRNSIRKDSAPGECILVDHMEYSTPGFISQLKRKQTKHRYRAEKIFLDHYSDLTYVHLQRGLLSDETVQEKKAFEDYTRKYKVKVKQYHAENGRFSYTTFLQAVKQENQMISYCGVNSHLKMAKKRNIPDIYKSIQENNSITPRQGG